MEKSRAPDCGRQILQTLLRGLIFIPLFLLLLTLLAVALERELLPQGREALWSLGCLFLTAVAAGRAAARRSRQDRLLFGLLGVADLTAFLLALGVFTKDSTVFNISLLCGLAAVIFGGLLGAMLAARRRRGRRGLK